MGDSKGFLKVKRKTSQWRPVCERIKDYAEVVSIPKPQHSEEQASRCMDCGTPFCHWGCPLANVIPDWNDAVFRGKWAKAFALLNATNNLPEITGRVCPAPCEYSCVLGINDDPVTIRENEESIIEYAFTHKLVKPTPPVKRTGKHVAVIGSGPAGLACADQLNKAGHTVSVFEKDDKAGGILRYGIPDFKLEKGVLDRRLAIWKREGVRFMTSTQLTQKKSVKDLLKEYDAVCLAMGSRQPRDLAIEGRHLKGIHFAMEYLIQSNKRVAGQSIPEDLLIDAQGKKVVVIGGGDTGADCVGVAHRQQAGCVIQVELLAMPPECRTQRMPWPTYPLLLKNSSSHQEGGSRDWSVLTKRFIGEDGFVQKLSCVRVKQSQDERGCTVIKEVAGTEFEIEADLVILALGFLHVEQSGFLASCGIDFDGRGNIKTDAQYMSSLKGIFAAGDARRGQSLIVWAISDGRQAAHSIDRYLMGDSRLPRL